jgi:hypothetical protein
MALTRKVTVKEEFSRVPGFGWLFGTYTVEKEVEEVIQALNDHDVAKDGETKESGSTSSVTAALEAGVEAHKATVIADPLPEAKNPLEPFYTKLEEASQRLNKLIDDWVKREASYIAGENSDEEIHDHLKKCLEESEDTHKSLAAQFFAQIKSIFVSAKDTLQDEITDAVKLHIRPIEDHIRKLIKESHGKSEAERRETAIHVARATIRLLNDAKALMGDIKHDIEQRVLREARAEATASIIINAAIYFIDQVTGIPFPYLNFDCTERYEHGIDDSTKEEQAETFEVIADVVGLSDRCAAEFNDLEAAATTPANTGNSVFSKPGLPKNDRKADAEIEQGAALRSSLTNFN